MSSDISPRGAGLDLIGPAPRVDTELLATLTASPVWRTTGDTPLARMWGLAPPPARVFGKLESFNPGGSIKDRVVKSMFAKAVAAGEITRDTVVVESSSGNTAIGLAQLCAVAGLRLVCVVDPRTSSTNLEILRAYGAEIDMIHAPDPDSGEYLQARLRRVAELLETVPDSFWPNQYDNPAVIAAHVEGTLPEISRALSAPPDYLYCAVSTCGTLLGCSKYLADNGWPTRLVAVDVMGSQIFARSPRTSRKFPGIGAPFAPPFADHADVWRVERVSDADCVAGCRAVASTSGILVGASSGAVVAAATRVIAADPRPATHVLILPDRGERYLDTVFGSRGIRGRTMSEHTGHRTDRTD